jgi:hypothetical protein
MKKILIILFLGCWFAYAEDWSIITLEPSSGRTITSCSTMFGCTVSNQTSTSVKFDCTNRTVIFDAVAQCNLTNNGLVSLVDPSIDAAYVSYTPDVNCPGCYLPTYYTCKSNGTKCSNTAYMNGDGNGNISIYK